MDSAGLLRKLAVEQRRKESAAVKEFVEAALSADGERFYNALITVDKEMPWVWSRCMRAMARVSCSDEFRRVFLQIYLQSGDHISTEVGDDLALVDGLRSLLPVYDGPARTLYRGDSARNRRRRTYGAAWSASMDVALSYAATGMWRTFDGGSVLLEAFAAREAIVCAPGLLDDRYGEQEYIVDRRLLTAITVIERFSQMTIHELDAMRTRWSTKSNEPAAN